MSLLRYFRHHLKPDIYGPGYKGAINQVWRESPIYLFSVTLFTLSGALIPLLYLKWLKMEGQKRRFMYQYTIMRPSHPHKDLYFYIDVTDKNNIIDPARKCYYDLD